jgi:hypothetical protein
MTKNPKITFSRFMAVSAFSLELNVRDYRLRRCHFGATRTTRP